MAKLATLIITRAIDSAHFIENHPGKCKTLHGHRWTIEVTIKGKIQDDGMVCDFGNIKLIIDALDHKPLNDFLKVPTAENLSVYLKDKIQEIARVSVLKVKVWETPDCLVIYE